MALTELENHLLKAVRGMESRLEQRMDSLDGQIADLSLAQAQLQREMQMAHGLVSELERLWTALGGLSKSLLPDNDQ